MRYVKALGLSCLVLMVTGSLVQAEEKAPAPAPSYPTAKLFGFVHFWGRTDYLTDVKIWDNSTFMVARARLGAAGDIRQNVSYVILTEAGQLSNTYIPSARAVNLVDCYATWKLDPLLNLRFGQDFYRFTFEGDLILPRLPFIFRAEAVDAVWLTMGRKGVYAYDVGLWAFGESRHDMLPFEGGYQLALTNGTGLNQSDDNELKDITARLYIEPFCKSQMPIIKDLHIGGSFFQGYSRALVDTANTIFADLQDNAYAAELVLPNPRWRIIGEWLWANYRGSGSVERLLQSGGYAALGVTPIKNLEVLGRYAVYNQNEDRDEALLTTITFGCTYTFGKLSNVKVNYLLRDYGSGYIYSGSPSDLLIGQLQFMW